MTLCTHYAKNKCKISGCKHSDRKGGCIKNGVIETKKDDFRLQPVDKIAPW